MFDRIGFVVGEALIALRRNGFLTIAAISTVAVSLFLLGGMVYIVYRAQSYADTIPGQFEIRVFLKDGTSLTQIQQTAKTIRDIPGVKDAMWIPRDKAWALYAKKNPDLAAGIENPLPDAFKVTLKELSYSNAVCESLKKLPTADPNEGIQHLGDVEQIIDRLLNVLRWFGGVLGGTLLVTAGILIYIAIRMTIVSRRKEVRIMQLVGASRFTVLVPFLIEGLCQGVLGGCVAAGLLSAGHWLVGQRLARETLFHLPPFPILNAFLILGAVGGAYGLLCSTVAANAPLKNQ